MRGANRSREWAPDERLRDEAIQTSAENDPWLWKTLRVTAEYGKRSMSFYDCCNFFS